MKKVLAIAPYPYLPYFSGGQKFIANFFEHLSHETNLAVISTRSNDFSQVRYKTLPWLKESFSRYGDLGLVKKVSDYVSTEHIDTLIIEHPYYAWLAHRVKKITGVKTIIHTHNIEYQRFQSMGKWWSPLLKSYEKKSFEKADCIFFITPEDREFATLEWKIAKEKCVDVPFGISLKEFPGTRDESRKLIADKHGIADNEKILSFNGLLDYKPNLNALKLILDVINPLLLQQKDFKYKIIISGKRLPSEYKSLESYATQNIIFTGFVDDIVPYLEATNIFLNPVLTGGGVKTKIVEAIGHGTTVVSTLTGATGVAKEVCGEKLVTVPDNEWSAFTSAIVKHSIIPVITPHAYYQYYYWGNIIKNISTAL